MVIESTLVSKAVVKQIKLPILQPGQIALCPRAGGKPLKTEAWDFAFGRCLMLNGVLLWIESMKRNEQNESHIRVILSYNNFKHDPGVSVFDYHLCSSTHNVSNRIDRNACAVLDNVWSKNHHRIMMNTDESCISYHDPFISYIFGVNPVDSDLADVLVDLIHERPTCWSPWILHQHVKSWKPCFIRPGSCSSVVTHKSSAWIVAGPWTDTFTTKWPGRVRRFHRTPKWYDSFVDAS